jgi:DNA-packaging protein gp3
MAAPKGHPAYNKNNPGGRPREWTDDLIEKEADMFREWLNQETNIWFEKFAIERGYPDSYLIEFSKRNEKFRAVYEYAKSWQKTKLVTGGLLNEFNSNITKLVLFNTCGWSDKQETKISGDAANPLKCLLDKADGISKEFVKDEPE